MMWIMKKSKDMLQYIQSMSLPSCDIWLLYPLHNYFPFKSNR